MLRGINPYVVTSRNSTDVHIPTHHPTASNREKAQPEIEIGQHLKKCNKLIKNDNISKKLKIQKPVYSFSNRVVVTLHTHTLSLCKNPSKKPKNPHSIREKHRKRQPFH
jgi:hypothetical protein